MTWWSDCSLIDREQGALLERNVTVWQGDTCVGCGSIAKWYSIWAIVSIWMSCWPGVLAKNGKYEGRRSTADWFCGYEIITIFPIIVIWLGIKSVECHHHIYPRVNKRQNHLGIRWWNRKTYEINELQFYRPTQWRGWDDLSLGLVCHPSQEVQLLRLHCLDHRSLNLIESSTRCIDRWPVDPWSFLSQRTTRKEKNKRVWSVYAPKPVNTSVEPSITLLCMTWISAADM